MCLQEAILTGQSNIHKGLRFQEFVKHRSYITLVIVPSKTKILIIGGTAADPDSTTAAARLIALYWRGGGHRRLGISFA